MSHAFVRIARRPAGFLFLLLLLSLTLLQARQATAATTAVYTVRNSSDVITAGGCTAASCSLRDAINAANGGVADSIVFNIPGSEPGCSGANNCTITLNSTLPALTDTAPTVIDGSGADITIDGNGNQIMTVAVDAVVTLNRLSLTGGKAANGGAVQSFGALKVVGATFNQNFAEFNGGAISSVTPGTLTVVNSAFVRNEAQEFGSALENKLGVLSVVNSTFSENVAGQAAAIYGTEASISHSTFFGNDGGGIFEDDNAAPMNVGNSLFRGGSGDNCIVDNGGSIVDGGGNFSDDNSCGFSGDNTNPLLDSLDDNGGPTLTHALLPGSPALDGAVLGSCASDDQRFLPRPLGAGCDSGAYEEALQFGPDFVVNSTADDNGDCEHLGVGNCTLREAVREANSSPGDNLITFDIPAADAGCTAANECVIAPGSPVANISDSSGTTTIDASGAAITVDYNAAATRFTNVNVAAALHLRGLDLTNTFAAGAGGAMQNDGTLTLEQSSITGSESNSNGGAIWNAGTLLVRESLLEDNDAGNSGGAVFNEGTAVFAGSTLLLNVAQNLGGGIYNDGGELRLDQTLLRLNTAINGGGGLQNAGGNAAVVRSTFAFNSAFPGAALRSVNGSLDVINSSFSYQQGDAILTDSGRVAYSTFVGNDGSDLVAEGPLTVRNSLLQSSTGNNCVLFGGTITDGGGNISDDASCSFTQPNSFSSTNPQVSAALTLNNGGQVPTHDLLAGSPAIDNANIAACPPLDQRGNTRPRGARCDSGALEKGAFVVNSSADTSDGLCSPLSSGDCTLREAVQLADAPNSPGPILFAIPADDPGCSAFNVCTIDVGSPLPQLFSTTSGGTVIDGTDADITIDGGGTVRPFQTGIGTALTLRGLTVQNTSANSGGVVFSQGDVTIEDSVLQDSSATGSGAVIFNTGGDVTIAGSIFRDNTAASCGAVCVLNGGLDVRDSRFERNVTSGLGGAIQFNAPATATVVNSAFVDNEGNRGGAIDASAGDMTVESSSFIGNDATSTYGGAINFLPADTQQLLIRNSTFSGNTSVFGGNALFAGTGTVVHSTFSGNGAADAAVTDFDGTEPLVLQNTVLAANGAANCGVDFGGVLQDGGGNISDDATCGFGAGSSNSTNPLLEPTAAQNGGPTLTHLLQSGSPALGYAVGGNCPAADQRGVPRPQGGGCDSGAVEAQQAFLLPGDALPICGAPQTVEIWLAGVQDVNSYQVVVSYDNSVVTPTAAFDNSWFDTTTNATSLGLACVGGTCTIQAAKVPPGTPVSGSGRVATLTLDPLAPGSFGLALVSVLLVDDNGVQSFPAVPAGPVDVSVCGTANVSGTVDLQPSPGAPLSDTLVTLADESGAFAPAYAAPDGGTGDFLFPGYPVVPLDKVSVTAGLPLHLSAARTNETLNPGGTLVLPLETLLGGDATNDDAVNINDLSCIGSFYNPSGGTVGACANGGSSDVNLDGSTTIFDLTLAGGNFLLVGPRPW